MYWCAGPHLQEARLSSTAPYGEATNLRLKRGELRHPAEVDRGDGTSRRGILSRPVARNGGLPLHRFKRQDDPRV